MEDSATDVSSDSDVPDDVELFDLQGSILSAISVPIKKVTTENKPNRKAKDDEKKQDVPTKRNPKDLGEKEQIKTLETAKHPTPTGCLFCRDLSSISLS